MCLCSCVCFFPFFVIFLQSLLSPLDLVWFPKLSKPLLYFSFLASSLYLHCRLWFSVFPRMLCFDPLSLDLPFSHVMFFFFSPVVFFSPFPKKKHYDTCFPSSQVDRDKWQQPSRLCFSSPLPSKPEFKGMFLAPTRCLDHKYAKQSWTETWFIKCFLLAIHAQLRDKCMSDNSHSHHSCMTHALGFTLCFLSTSMEEKSFCQRSVNSFTQNLGLMVNLHKGQMIHRWVSQALH